MTSLGSADLETLSVKAYLPPKNTVGINDTDDIIQFLHSEMTIFISSA